MYSFSVQDEGQQTRILEEVHFHHTLHDFEELVNQGKVDQLMAEMQEEPFWMLYKWFTNAFKG